MANKYDVIVIGSATKDVFLNVDNIQPTKVDKFPTGQALCFGFGSKIAIDRMAFTSGGGGTNVAVTLARQGFKTACVGAIGPDFNGRELLEELQKEGIDCDYFQKEDDGYIAYSVILVTANGERTILSYKGEGQHFDVNKIKFDEMSADWLSLNSLGGHYDLFEKSIQWAVASNMKIITNPGTKELEHGLEKIRPLLNKCAIVTLNQEEASMLSGIPFAEEDKLFKFMDEVVDGIFVMTKGPLGVSVSDGMNIYSASVPDSPVIERTGAGDAFYAAFCSEIMRTGDIAKAIQLGTANATSVVQYYGGKKGILMKDDMGKFPLVEVTIKSIST
jgi:sugar/nucleoside kinase (ribokinase family)